MKRLYSFFFLTILFMSSPIAPLFSKVTTPSLPGRAGGGSSGGASSSYSALWKAEQKLEAEGKPQSAYEVVQTILQKAQAEGHQGQAMSARLRAAGLHQEWAPDSFFTDIAELEALRAQEKRPEAKAIYASILAEIYENNRRRAQASRLQLESEDMKEWTREQYDSAAIKNWQLSLVDIPALGAAKSKDWLPFVVQASHSSYFNHDLLHILWQRARDQHRDIWRDGVDGTAIKTEYQRQGNREAQLLMDLDLIRLAYEDTYGDNAGRNAEVDKLLALTKTYADLPLCAEIYDQLLRSDAEVATAAKKVEWAEEAIRRYPRYERIGMIRSALNELRRPSVIWSGNDIYYPGKTYTWKLTTQNATAVELSIYRLKDDFQEEMIEKSKHSVNEYFRRNATLIETLRPTIKRGKPYQALEDTLQWTAPTVGRYAILYSATTDERGALKKTVTNQYSLFRVTSLKTMHRFLTENELEVIVVDAESGQPVAGAHADLYQVEGRSGKRTLVSSQQVNAKGVARFRQINKGNRSRLVLQVAATVSPSSASGAAVKDHYLPEESLWGGVPSLDEEQQSLTIRLYTDRAIYRPGQTVHLSGIAYNQLHWDAQAKAGHALNLHLRDANWKIVDDQDATTDSMGVFTADFALPEGGLPGVYRIQTDGGSVSFRVEEYKRPTFEVKMDEAPALQWPQDSITLTGKAIGYNGVPVRNARVTGTYQFTYPYFWWFRHDDSPEFPIDTLQTDDSGTFLARVPLKDIPAEALTYGLVLRLNVEVLSAAGETREGNLRVPLCTTPLRLNITMNEQQDRDRLQPPTFSLLSSTGKPVEGDIRCAIYPAQAAASSPSDEDFSPSDEDFSSAGKESASTIEAVVADASASDLEAVLRALPSGDYELRATARAGSDTASARARFYLFSMDDTRLPRSAEQWLYCPTDTFDAQHPARIQFGSSFEDVALYFSLTGQDGLIRSELIPLSNELRTMEIPYLPEYGDGATMHIAFVKKGTCYTNSHALKLTLPSKQLKWQWTSFRDRLHPGDHETWTLRLTDAEGKPVGANLMATIYDASLDQLTPHTWDFIVHRYHRLRFMPWRSQDFFASGNASQHLYFAMKDYNFKALDFDAFDPKWTAGLSFGFPMYGMRMMKSSRAAGVVMEEASMATADMLEAPMAAPMMMAAKAAPQNAALQGRIAGTEVLEGRIAGTEVQEDEDDGSPVVGGSSADEALSAAPASLRTNFNETAAFLPRLHSDPATGEVTLSFTLPESLTTWQLLGIAHTSDLQTANIQAQTIASKEMMARLYMPRFLRAGDQGSLRAAVQNLTEQPLSGNARLEVFDPETEKVILKKKASFTAEAKGEAVLSFDYSPTEELPIVAVRFVAETKEFSDGEQHFLAILSSKEHLTESVEIQADGQGTFTTDLSSLFNHNAASATQRRLTVEYTTHPIWNVVQALPALREPQNDDVLSITSVFYANTLAAHIAATTPRLHDIIALWKQQAAAPSSSSPSSSSLSSSSSSSSRRSVLGGSSAKASPLSTDADLKELLLSETPWLREADSDAERRAQLIDLFNENLVANRIGGALEKLRQRQEPDGGFSWFPGMRSSELMTRLVCMELTHLRTLTDDFSSLSPDIRQQTNILLQQAFTFVATENAKMIQEMKKAEAKGATINTGTLMHLHYIYISKRAGISLSKAQQADVRYLLDHLKGSVAGMTNDERAMAAIVLKDYGRDKESSLYFDSMKEHLTTTTAHGTFFDYAGGSFTPTGHKVIIHTAAMEAMRELAPEDHTLNGGLRRWLLQQKRTQMWESSICTTDAIYALLHGTAGAADLQSTAKDNLTLHFGKRKVPVSPITSPSASQSGTLSPISQSASSPSVSRSGTLSPVSQSASSQSASRLGAAHICAESPSPAALGYLRATFTDGAAPTFITVERRSPSEAWGAVYAQYLTPIADASAHSTGLTIRRELSSTAPRLGDKLTTRYIITADRDYEYVCLRADRAAAAEPEEQISGYRYQGGLGYYRAVRDAHTDYFFDSLPKGTYVLEETSFIDRTGRYTTGLCRLQCIYAPEFSSHTNAVELDVK